jgi:tetratricopeptide (TPR) repeat protein
LAAAFQPAKDSQPATESDQSSAPPLSSAPKYSADALYNLANSYARAGKPGMAVLNYERAMLLAPNDPDIAANLGYVRASKHLPAEPLSRFAPIGQVMSPTSAAWLAVVGIILIGSALLTRHMARHLRWPRAVALLLGAVSLAVTASQAMLLWPHLHEAVVLTNQTPALVSPVPMADTAFVLPEAETVTMAAKHDDYILVRTRAGLSGWVNRASLGAVVP